MRPGSLIRESTRLVVVARQFHSFAILTTVGRGFEGLRRGHGVQFWSFCAMQSVSFVKITL